MKKNVSILLLNERKCSLHTVTFRSETQVCPSTLLCNLTAQNDRKKEVERGFKHSIKFQNPKVISLSQSIT